MFMVEPLLFLNVILLLSHRVLLCTKNEGAQIEMHNLKMKIQPTATTTITTTTTIISTAIAPNMEENCLCVQLFLMYFKFSWVFFF